MWLKEHHNSIIWKRTRAVCGLTCSGAGTGAILSSPLIDAAVPQRHYGGAQPALTPQAGHAQYIRHAAQLQHFALANEALVVDMQSQLQFARIERKALGVVYDFIDLRLQLHLWCLPQNWNRLVSALGGSDRLVDTLKPVACAKLKAVLLHILRV